MTQPVPAWSVEDVRALCRGAGFRHVPSNPFGVEVFVHGFHALFIHPNRIDCAYDGPATRHQFVKLEKTPDDAIAWLLTWWNKGAFHASAADD